MLHKNIKSWACLTLVICLSYFCGCDIASMPLPEETPQATYAIDHLSGTGNSDYQLNQTKINSLIGKIEAGTFGEIHSLIIIQNNKLVTEAYFNGWTRHMLHPCFSTTKSVTSAIFGIAKDQGAISDLNDKMLDYFPEYTDITNMDARKQAITIKQLLTMSAGFVWNELEVPYADFQGNLNPENDLVKMYGSPDWIKNVLDRPMQDIPGQRWVYNTGCTELLSGVINKTTGMSVAEYAQATLFADLGITVWNWNTGPNNITDAGAGLYLHPVNMAMLGYLYLNNGRLDNHQIVSSQWVNESTTKHIDASHLGLLPAGYGYQWYHVAENYCDLNLIFRNPRTNNIYYALGFGGQYIYVAPEFDMVVVMTSWTPQTEFMQNLIFNSILRSVTYR